jgi:hypothetical protein
MQRWPLPGITPHQVPRKCPQGFVFFPEVVKQEPKNPPTGPSVCLDRTVPQLLLDLGRHPIFCSAMVIDLLVLVLYLHCNIEVNDFQAEVVVDKKVVRLDITVSDTVPLYCSQGYQAEQSGIVRTAK